MKKAPLGDLLETNLKDPPDLRQKLKRIPDYQ